MPVTIFQYHPDILARYPNVVGGVILAEGLTNSPTSASLQEAFLAEQRATLRRLDDSGRELHEVPSLAAWRSVFRGFGLDPTKYRSAPEALLRRLIKKGSIPSINTLVDLGNLVSIHFMLPIAVFDTRAVRGPITVHFADGSERYTTLGENEEDHPTPGEVIFTDETKLVLARRWCWRQSEQSAAREDTTQAIITIEAHHAEGRDDVEMALTKLLGLLSKHTGGEFLSGMLDARHPALTSFS
jgi:DNA/RNA-binding domain of Phe-tRNA-synthetase-like protein